MIPAQLTKPQGDFPKCAFASCTADVIDAITVTSPLMANPLPFYNKNKKIRKNAGQVSALFFHLLYKVNVWSTFFKKQLTEILVLKSLEYFLRKKIVFLKKKRKGILGLKSLYGVLLRNFANTRGRDVLC